MKTIKNEQGEQKEEEVKEEEVNDGARARILKRRRKKHLLTIKVDNENGCPMAVPSTVTSVIARSIPW